MHDWCVGLFWSQLQYVLKTLKSCSAEGLPSLAARERLMTDGSVTSSLEGVPSLSAARQKFTDIYISLVSAAGLMWKAVVHVATSIGECIRYMPVASIGRLAPVVM